MTFQLEHRVVVITGATGGLGQALVAAFLQAGSVVVALGRNQAKLEQLAAASQYRLYYAKLDFNDEAAIHTTLARIERQLGPIAVLINNAGVGYFETALTLTAAQRTAMVQLNELSLMAFCQQVGRLMVPRGAGMIVNVASQAGKIATPKASVYAASKAAVIAYSNALRLELAPAHVGVLTVNPGPIATPFLNHADPSGQYAQAVARLALAPTTLAAAVVKAVATQQRELNRPLVMNAAAIGYQLAPHLADWLAQQPLFNRK